MENILNLDFTEVEQRILVDLLTFKNTSAMTLTPILTELFKFGEVKKPNDYSLLVKPKDIYLYKQIAEVTAINIYPTTFKAMLSGKRFNGKPANFVMKFDKEDFQSGTLALLEVLLESKETREQNHD